MLTIDNVTAGYGSVPILQGVSLQVEPGRIVSVVGPNGAGKTTLLRTSAGFLKTSEGSVSVDGKGVRGGRPAAARKLGAALVPEGRGIFGSMTVMDNLVLGAYSVPRRQRSALIAERLTLVFELFPMLAEFQGRTAGLLSGGQQQMLAIGRALIGDPRYLLLDEPSTGLSPTMHAVIAGAIRSVAQAGAGVLLVEQLLDLALGLADVVHVMRGGRLVGSEPATVFRQNKALLEQEYFGVGAGAAQ